MREFNNLSVGWPSEFAFPWTSVCRVELIIYSRRGPMSQSARLCRDDRPGARLTGSLGHSRLAADRLVASQLDRLAVAAHLLLPALGPGMIGRVEVAVFPGHRVAQSSVPRRPQMLAHDGRGLNLEQEAD